MSDETAKIPEDVLDALLASCNGPDDLKGEAGFISLLTKQLNERAAVKVRSQSLLGESTTVNARQLQKQQLNLEDTVLSMFARGYNAREIQRQLQDLAGHKVSIPTISRITEATTEEMKNWISRPLDSTYSIVFLDCLFIKIRDGSARPKAVYVAIAINMEGKKEAIGVWIAQTEGAGFWRQALLDLQNRGVQDIFVVCVDGLRGFPEAIATVFPRSTVQLCVVHLVRRCISFVMVRKRGEVANDLKRIYTSSTLEMAELRLGEFERRWGAEHPTIVQIWRKAWPEIAPLFDFPADIRRVIYTTNIVESVNMSLRRVTTYRVFLNDEALLKLLFLALRNISKRWSRPIRDWKMAMRHFSIMFEERMS